MNDERLDIERYAQGITNTADRAKVDTDSVKDAAHDIVKGGYDLGQGIVRGWHHANPDAIQGAPGHAVDRVVEQAKESLGRAIRNGIADATEPEGSE